MSRRERKKEETRKNIIDCAMQLFREKGFRVAMMEEISEKADVSKGTLYNYFPDKESILVAHFQTSIAEQSGKIVESVLRNGDIRSRLISLLDFLYGLLVKESELTAIYFSYRMSRFFDSNPVENSLRSGLEPLILKVVEGAQNNGELRNDIPPLVMARNFLISNMNLFILSILHKEDVEIASVKEQLVDLYLNGAKK